MYYETLTQRLALANGIVPQTLNNARLFSDGIDMQKAHRALFIVHPPVDESFNEGSEYQGKMNFE